MRISVYRAFGLGPELFRFSVLDQNLLTAGPWAKNIYIWRLEPTASSTFEIPTFPRPVQRRLRLRLCRGLKGYVVKLRKFAMHEQIFRTSWRKRRTTSERIFLMKIDMFQGRTEIWGGRSVGKCGLLIMLCLYYMAFYRLYNYPTYVIEISHARTPFVAQRLLYNH